MRLAKNTHQSCSREQQRPLVERKFYHLFQQGWPEKTFEEAKVGTTMVSPSQETRSVGKGEVCSFVDTVRFPEQSKKYVFLSRKTKKICSFVGTERFPQHLTRGPSSSVAEERMNLPTNG
ncbi:hypothetical protein NPIL_512312 [Nephila pilipes]|uniref:Uncharacterized protein n=1 Tax=Nephila pilipes TaxID=299642 RepID=A0A8X6UNV6_NEPPI|nr:hypothetical protein NPIL_512312 [Nephila pilipes]